MKRIAVYLFLVILALGTALPAQAENTPPDVLKRMEDAGAKIDFLGHEYGVDGWRISPKEGNASYAYTTPEGGVLLGILLDSKGGSVTNRQLKAMKSIREGSQKALPGAEKSSSASIRAERLYAEVEKSGWTAAGDITAPYLYLFVNTLCDHCQRLWENLQPSIRSGQLQVRIVPFGRVEENRITGAALLSVDDPAAAWNAYLRGETAALGKDKIKSGMIDKVDANTDLFGTWGMQGPPFTIYRRPADGQIMVVPGVPENIMVVLADLLKG